MKYPNQKKFALVLSALIIISASSTWANMPMHVLAANPPQTITSFTNVLSTEQAPNESNDELFNRYVNKRFGKESHTARIYKDLAKKKLSGSELIIYNTLKSKITEVANGYATSTQFAIPITALTKDGKTEFTEAEAGVALSPTMTDQAKNTLCKNLLGFTEDSILNVYKALLADCPYELYWHDKTAGALPSFGYELRTVGQTTTITFLSDLTIDFIVDVGYRGSTMYRMDTSKINTVNAAVQAAQNIVAAAKDKSDFEKLDYYRKEICRLTAYNNNISHYNDTGTKNPWQLIYVFDHDETTNVVCEGYAKAFQYLCDLTNFENNIYSCIVSGTMTGVSNAGPHMWNIVHIGDNGNYLVDLTNCDGDHVGAEDLLFLTGYSSGNPENGYTIQLSNGYNITYEYHTDMKQLYSDQDLTLVPGGKLQETQLHTHKYKADYQWSPNYDSCNVQLTCEYDPTHTISMPGAISRTVQAPTCIAKGITTYTATAAIEEKPYSNTQVVENIAIDPNNHTGETVVRDAKKATATTAGYSGDTYCKSCGVKIANGKTIPATNGASQPAKDNHTPDDSFSNVVTTDLTNTSGKTVTVTTTTKTDTSGSIIEVIKQSAIANIAADASADVTVRSDAAGTVTDVQAAVTKTIDNGKRVTLTSDILTQIKEAAEQEHAMITMTVKDAKGKIKYILKADTDDLVPGESLYLYIQKESTGEYVMVNNKAYSVTTDGSISVSASAANTYRLVNKTQASKINKEILKTVKLKKTSASIQTGKTTRITLNNKLNTDNIQTITYVSSKKTVAKVSASGKITAKKAGTATIKAKVTLKNGTTKTVSMKIKVK